MDPFQLPGDDDNMSNPPQPQDPRGSRNHNNTQNAFNYRSGAGAASNKTTVYQDNTNSDINSKASEIGGLSQLKDDAMGLQGKAAELGK